MFSETGQAPTEEQRRNGIHTAAVRAAFRVLVNSTMPGVGENNGNAITEGFDYNALAAQVAQDKGLSQEEALRAVWEAKGSLDQALEDENHAKIIPRERT